MDIERILKYLEQRIASIEESKEMFLSVIDYSQEEEAVIAEKAALTYDAQIKELSILRDLILANQLKEKE